MLQRFLTKIATVLFGLRYHPERHYMRGPGPACQAALNGAPLRHHWRKAGRRTAPFSRSSPEGV